MLTDAQNVMAATYPDVFKAAIVYSGVGAGCFVSSSGGIDAWNNTCANGQSHATPQAWAKVVFDSKIALSLYVARYVLM